MALPPGALTDLGTARQRSGKVVTAWAAEGALDADAVRSNTFEMEWPPRSGRMQAFPEVDRAGWFALGAAREKLNPAQVAFIERLAELLARSGGAQPDR
jgi:predicted NUDIX family NTP pyrophosphohydrolase